MRLRWAVQWSSVQDDVRTEGDVRNQTFKQTRQMYSHKVHALRNFIDWSCQACGADLWLIPHDIGAAWSLNFCSDACSHTPALPDELVAAVKGAVASGRYYVDALEIADAMLDGVPPQHAVGLRSRQWRERRISELADN